MRRTPAAAVMQAQLAVRRRRRVAAARAPRPNLSSSLDLDSPHRLEDGSTIRNFRHPRTSSPVFQRPRSCLVGIMADDLRGNLRRLIGAGGSPLGRAGATGLSGPWRIRADCRCLSHGLRRDPPASAERGRTSVQELSASAGCAPGSCLETRTPRTRRGRGRTPWRPCCGRSSRCAAARRRLTRRGPRCGFALRSGVATDGPIGLGWCSRLSRFRDGG